MTLYFGEKEWFCWLTRIDVGGWLNIFLPLPWLSLSCPLPLLLFLFHSPTVLTDPVLPLTNSSFPDLLCPVHLTSQSSTLPWVSPVMLSLHVIFFPWLNPRRLSLFHSLSLSLTHIHTTIVYCFFYSLNSNSGVLSQNIVIICSAECKRMSESVSKEAVLLQSPRSEVDWGVRGRPRLGWQAVGWGGWGQWWWGGWGDWRTLSMVRDDLEAQHRTK